MSEYIFDATPRNVPKVNTSNRVIQTEIPAPGTKEILTKLSKYESRSMHGQLPLVWHCATGHSVYDPMGNKWIDFTSTIFVANVGHANSKVLEAISASIQNSMLACYAYPNIERAEYLENLIKFAGKGFEKAFLMSAGTEATEAAMKLMKLHGLKLGKKKNLVIGISGNWHGRTMGAQVLSNNHSQRNWITNPDTETLHIPFPYDDQVDDPVLFLEESLANLSSRGVDLADDVCGFMLETFQGWGACFYPEQYVKGLRKICDRYNILLAFDEMQSGFGRTGKNFGYEHYGVTADLICCGKGMGGGLPISGVIGKAEILDLPEVGNMSSTHSGNPLITMAANAVLKEIQDKRLVRQAEEKGALLHKELEKLKIKYPEYIKKINGKGLIAAIIFEKTEKFNESNVSKIAERCLQKGLLVVHTGRESIKIGPPLVITEEALCEGVEVLDEAIWEIIHEQ